MYVMEKWKNLQTEISNKELEEIVNEGKDAKEAAKVEELEKAHRQMVTNTKVLIHGTL